MMAVSSNGFAKKPKARQAQAQGTLAKQQQQQQQQQTQRALVKSSAKAKGSFSASKWLFSTAARLFTWYCIISILFRCPENLEACNESSPAVCKQYFRLKNAVSPHVEPYYETYAAPYVEIAKPYYDVVDNYVITPGRTYADKYAAPRLSQAKAYGQLQWDKNVQPQVVKYQKSAQTKYDETIAPHVNTVSKSVGPYYTLAKSNALQTYYQVVVPSYAYVLPYAAQGYVVTQNFASETVYPSATWAWNKTYLFLDSTVWPQLRVIYAENVEPQLVRIGERLGRHKQGDRSKSTPEPVSASPTTRAKKASTFSKPAPSSAPTPANAEGVSPETTSESQSTTPSANSEAVVDDKVVADSEKPPAGEEIEDDRPVAEIVADDLEQWESKFSKAAEDGAAEIETRIQEISQTLIKDQVKVSGKSLLTKLQQTVDKALIQLKQDIITIAGKEESQSTEDSSREDQSLQAVRKAGATIKQNAQDVRVWKDRFEQKLQAAVTQAAQDHFRILDEIRDLALQKIGMKWAWMDGVTYKDWAKYHSLRDRLAAWTDDLKNLVITHPGLNVARDAASEIEDSAMDIAQAAAMELGRLKQVSSWKIAAGDASDDFDSESTKAAADAAAAAAAASAPSSSSSVSAKAEEAESTVPDAEVIDNGSTPAEGAEVVSKLEEEEREATAVSEATDLPDAEQASSVSPIIDTSSIADVDGEQQEQQTKDKKEGIVSQASEEILGKIPDIAENLTYPDGEATTEKTTEDEDEAIANNHPAAAEEAKEPEAAASVKPVFLGAMAQFVANNDPILDEESDPVAAFTSKALDLYSSAAAKASSRYATAVSIVYAQNIATTEPVHVQLLASVTSAYRSAMSTASVQLDKAMGAASEGVYGTPTTNALPTYVDWAHIQSIAVERLNEGREWAEVQYQSAKIAAGLATATPTGTVDKALRQAKLNYFAGLGAAEARYSQFLDAASSAVNSLTATPTPSDIAGKASSVASVASENVASLGSVASENASSIAVAANESVVSAASVVGDSASSIAVAANDSVVSAASVVSESASSVVAAAGDAASSVVEEAKSFVTPLGGTVAEGWNDLVAQISAGVWGETTPLPWYGTAFEDVGDYFGNYATAASDKAAAAAAAVTGAADTYGSAASEEAAKRYSVVSSIMSELVIGKEPTFSESVFSRLNAVYTTAAASASSLASEAADAAASATEAAKSNAQKIKDEL